MLELCKFIFVKTPLSEFLNISERDGWVPPLPHNKLVVNIMVCQGILSSIVSQLFPVISLNAYAHLLIYGFFQRLCIALLAPKLPFIPHFAFSLSRLLLCPCDVNDAIGQHHVLVQVIHQFNLTSSKKTFPEVPLH